MFLTTALALATSATLAEGVRHLHQRYCPQEPWEPSFHDMRTFRDSNWQLVGHTSVARDEIEERFEEGGLFKLDSYMWRELSKSIGLGPHDWNQWSITWRHGCLDKDEKTRLKAVRATQEEGELTVFFYDAVPKAPPKPAPLPEPEPVKSLWTAADEGRRLLSYYRNPKGFWLAPEGKAPWIRIYDDGTVVDTQNGSSVQGFHADLLYDPEKKLPFIVVTTGGEEGWQKKRYRTMEAADKAIAAYFVKCKAPPPLKHRVHALCENIDETNEKLKEIKWNCGLSLSTKEPKQKDDFYPTLHWVEGKDGCQYRFSTMKEAITFLQYREGYSMDEISNMMGGHRIFHDAIMPVLTPGYRTLDADTAIARSDREAIHITAEDLLYGRAGKMLRGRRVSAYQSDEQGGYICFITHQSEYGHRQGDTITRMINRNGARLREIM